MSYIFLSIIKNIHNQLDICGKLRQTKFTSLHRSQFHLSMSVFLCRPYKLFANTSIPCWAVQFAGWFFTMLLHTLSTWPQVYSVSNPIKALFSRLFRLSHLSHLTNHTYHFVRRQLWSRRRPTKILELPVSEIKRRHDKFLSTLSTLSTTKPLALTFHKLTH